MSAQLDETHAAIPSSLLSAARQQVMVDVLRSCFHGPIRMLEIGVWHAAGSTQVWLDHLPEGSELVLLDAWRPYASAEDLSGGGDAPSRWNYAAMDAQCEQAFEAALRRVRAHERSAERRVSVQVIRAQATQAMAWMRDGSFDLVYVDGDHKYAQVRRDLEAARRLVHPVRGVVCGDDLERLPDEATIALARLHLDRDYLGAPHRFHPGVCLAVHECFGSVQMSNGFWWVSPGMSRAVVQPRHARPTEDTTGART
jgi:hypothetical protein